MMKAGDRKLTLNKTTIKNMILHTGVRAGALASGNMSCFSREIKCGPSPWGCHTAPGCNTVGC